MIVHAYATASHYRAHILPILDALPPEVRGRFHAPRHIEGGAPGIPTGRALVASWADLHTVRKRGGECIFVEHGAGQTYSGKGERSPAYSGGDRREGVVLYLVPSETVAQRCRETQPDVPVAVIGTPPYLDRFLTARDLGHGAPETVGADRETAGQASRATIALSFHAPYNIVPEAGWAWPHYRSAIEALAREGTYRLLGHGHPRAWPKLEPWWRKIGVEPVRDFCDVLALQPDLYVIDNSSTGPEAAACGIPVLWLNAPQHRRDVEHGGRFFDWPRGQVQVDGPGDLADGIKAALFDPPEVQVAREAMVAEVYGFTDGRSTERAVEAIMHL